MFFLCGETSFALIWPDLEQPSMTARKNQVKVSKLEKKIA